MPVYKHALMKTAAPPYNVAGPTPFHFHADLAIADMPVIDDVSLLMQFPDKCQFGAFLDAANPFGLWFILNDYTTFNGELILCDEDGGNEVALAVITLDTLTEVGFLTLAADATQLTYDVSGRYLALKAETAIATATGSIDVIGQYLTGTKQFSA